MTRKDGTQSLIENGDDNRYFIQSHVSKYKSSCGAFPQSTNRHVFPQNYLKVMLFCNHMCLGFDTFDWHLSKDSDNVIRVDPKCILSVKKDA